jgi:type IV pilus assembly protein PilA
MAARFEPFQAIMQRSISARNSRRGFTLVELMVVVAILGVLATIGMDNLKQHINASKASEAQAAVGAIGRAIHVAADRDRTDGTILELGAVSTTLGGGSKVTGSTSGKGKGKGATVTHDPSGALCGDSDPVPAALSSVKGRKYQPRAGRGEDYNSGDAFTGWQCLKFTMEAPQYYQYQYKVGGPPVSVKLPHGGSPPGLSEDLTWTVTATGDLDADDKLSWFVLEGYILDTGEVIAAPAISTVDPDE